MDLSFLSSGAIPTEITALGDIFQGAGDLMVGAETQNAYNYNSAILANQAQEALTAGELTVEEIDAAEKVLLSTQKAMYAKAGVTSHGSPTDVALETATNFEFDKLVTTYNAKVAASNLESKAALEKYYGQVAANKAQFNMGQALLKGGMALMGIGGGGGGGGYNYPIALNSGGFA